MIKEAIILAGGLGTRLRSVVSDIPKCMAPVSGKPFLHYVIDHFKKKGVERFIFSIGYKSEVIQEYISKELLTNEYEFSIEEEPLGTGGAIKLAILKCSEKNVLVLNGDTLYKIETKSLSDLHEGNNAGCTLSLKPMKHFDRYGVVEINAYNSIRSFKEKKYYEEGLINGGVYALNIVSFSKKSLPDEFSFEKDYLEKSFMTEKFYGVVQDEYFIDIGIPEDYSRAQTELS